MPKSSTDNRPLDRTVLESVIEKLGIQGTLRMIVDILDEDIYLMSQDPHPRYSEGARAKRRILETALENMSTIL